MSFKLFGKPASPEKRLTQLGKKRDWAGLSRTYYELGVEAMSRSDLEHAQMWLNRADTIYSADNDVFCKVGEKLIDDCSDRIGQLEDAEELLYNAVPSAVDEKAEELSDDQVRVWGLLSIARLVKLGKRLSALPDCGVLGELEWAVDTMLRSLRDGSTKEEYQRLLDMCNDLYQLNGKPVYYCGEIEVAGKAPFQLFDLNGMFGVEQEINSYINSHLRLIDDLNLGMEPGGAESEMVGCTLLPDYYVRIEAGKLEEVPQIKAELARIWSDYDFICSGPTLKQVEERIKEYKELDLLA